VQILGGAAAGAVIGAVAGGVSHALRNPGKSLGEYVRDAEFRKAVGTSAASGAVFGAVYAAVPLGLAALGLKAATAGGAAFIGWVSGSLAGAAGQITANLLTPCTKWHHGVRRAMFWGGLGGAAFGWAGWHVRQWLANQIKPINPPTNRSGLRNAMPAHPSNMQNPQAHHDLPWTFKDWFAGSRRGLDVNNPNFGRWVEGTPPGPHQVWHGEYNTAWQTFIDNYPHADKWQVLHYLSQLLSSGKFPSR
jgi:hypothetical protein